MRFIKWIKHKMKDFLVALGLMFVIEGILCAAFPVHLKKSLQLVEKMNESAMRITGIICAVLGLIFVAVVRFLTGH